MFKNICQDVNRVFCWHLTGALPGVAAPIRGGWFGKCGLLPGSARNQQINKSASVTTDLKKFSKKSGPVPCVWWTGAEEAECRVFSVEFLLSFCECGCDPVRKSVRCIWTSIEISIWRRLARCTVSSSAATSSYGDCDHQPPPHGLKAGPLKDSPHKSWFF